VVGQSVGRVETDGGWMVVVAIVTRQSTMVARLTLINRWAK
jgi:hypothetical protein